MDGHTAHNSFTHSYVATHNYANTSYRAGHQTGERPFRCPGVTTCSQDCCGQPKVREGMIKILHLFVYTSIIPLLFLDKGQAHS